ncbi:MAG: hypothetical protein FWE95_11180 [Planctomycetaceae bacterium]|nr:hypothetical protein [Planctomycetaceae bacterium]
MKKVIRITGKNIRTILKPYPCTDRGHQGHNLTIGDQVFRVNVITCTPNIIEISPYHRRNRYGEKTPMSKWASTVSCIAQAAKTHMPKRITLVEFHATYIPSEMNDQNAHCGDTGGKLPPLRSKP